jgi:S-adenosylmethionine synthetase
MIELAECVLPGHPDKLCDAIADALVNAACVRHPRALVGVEVAIHRDTVLVTGCITTTPRLGIDEVIDTVRQVLTRAGYGGAWAPDPASVRVLTDVRLETLDADLIELRALSDDQAITIGWAGGRAEDRWLPRCHRLAWLLAQRLGAARVANGLGPDGKVIVVAEQGVVRRVSFSLHHAAGADRSALYALAARIVAAEGLERIELLVNGGGDFAVGGSHGDNGLSGKKLVVDAYGPTVPTGGGAWSGKDPHKVDRVGALRARQLALRALHRGLGREVELSLGWFPGDRSPSAVGLRLDGRPADPRLLGPVDLSIAGSHHALGLHRVDWAARAATAAWFQEPAPWEGSTAGGEKPCALQGGHPNPQMHAQTSAHSAGNSTASPSSSSEAQGRSRTPSEQAAAASSLNVQVAMGEV